MDPTSLLRQLLGRPLPEALGPPRFSSEGPQFYDQAYAVNKPFALPGPYTTKLAPADELMFRRWVAQNNVPFDPNAKVADYDMRGFWKDTGGHGWRPGAHFPDTYKTPYDTSFSRESRYSTPNNPRVWRGDTLVDTRTGFPFYASPTTRGK